MTSIIPGSDLLLDSEKYFLEAGSAPSENPPPLDLPISPASSSSGYGSEGDSYQLVPVTIRCQLATGKYLFVRGDGGGLDPHHGTALAKVGPDLWVAPIPQSKLKSYEWSLFVDKKPLPKEFWSTISLDSEIPVDLKTTIQGELEMGSDAPESRPSSTSSLISITEARVEFPREPLSYSSIGQKLLNDPSCTPELKTWLSNYFNQSDILSSSLANITFPECAFPHFELLKKVAAYYALKYQIEIQICTNEEFEKIVKEKTPKSSPVGIIITYYRKSVYSQTDQELSHVVPLILNFTEKTKEAVILDSLGIDKNEEPVHKFAFFPIGCFEDNGITQFFSRAARQAANGSCRTDAITILRNALLDLKSSRTESFSEKLSNQQIIRIDNYHSSAAGHYVHKMVSLIAVDIPLTWDYTNQISNKAEGARINFVARDLFSSSKGKRRKPRTIEQFRTEHRSRVTFHNSLSLNIQYGCTAGAPMIESVSPPYMIKEAQAYGAPAKFLVMKQIREVNTYLVLKGFKNHKKHGASL